MLLEVLRFSSQTESTLGLLFDISILYSKRKFLSFTLEDEYRLDKVQSETRIPANIYDLGIRTEGGFHNNYLKKFGPSFHKGMLHILNVPNFEYVLIHCGNTDEDTAGCLLVGNSSTQNILNRGSIGNSVEAYKRIYPPIINALLNKVPVKIKFTDYDSIVID